MIAKFDLGPAKPEGRRQTGRWRILLLSASTNVFTTKEVFFSYRFLGTIAQVTVT